MGHDVEIPTLEQGEGAFDEQLMQSFAGLWLEGKNTEFEDVLHIGTSKRQFVGAGFTPACWGAQNVTVRRTSTRGRKARAYVPDSLTRRIRP